MQGIEGIILSSLIHDGEYLRKVLPFMREEYFLNRNDRLLFMKIAAFVDQYNAPPTPEALHVALVNDKQVGEDEYAAVIGFLEGLEPAERTHDAWLLDETEKFCKDRAVHNAVVQAIQIIDGRDKNLSPDAIPGLLQDALGVGFDTNIGHDYDADAAGRYDFYHSDVERIPFDIDILNQITKGGVPRKTLNVLIGGINVGKTLALCHLGAAYKAQGKNVLHITLEMAEERIAERYDANLMNVSLDDLPLLSRDMYMDKVQKVLKRAQGKLVIKEYPTASAHAGHFRALLNELRLKKDFIPDVILVDYLNICASSRYKLSGQVNSYTYVKAIAEELRGLAVEFDVPIWTATQLTRTGFSSSDIEMTDTAESFGLPATADFMLGMISNEDMEKLGQYMFKQLKNRYNSKVSQKRFLVGVDTSKMRLYNVEASAQKTVMQEAAPTKSEKPDWFTKPKTTGKADFSGIKL